MKRLWGSYRFVILACIIWRSILFFAELASAYIPIFSETYVGKIPWANTDGLNYVRIAEWGYGSLNEAFFPLYPLLLRGIHFVIPLTLEYIGVFVSTLCFFIGLIILYAFVAKTSIHRARWVVLFILSFPTAFFFTAVYTESLFFLLTVLVLYFSQKKKWLVAGICVSLASATRIIGICTGVFVLYEIWKSKNSLTLRDVVGIVIMPLGLLSYMYYLYASYGDALRFIHIQALYEINRSGSTFIFLPQVIWRYMKIFFTTFGKTTGILYGVSIGEFVLTLGGFYLLYFGWKKKVNPSYLLYSLVALTIPTLTGTFMSMPRYILSIVPLFIILTHVTKCSIKYGIISIFSILQIVSVMVYLRGWFIA